VFVWLRYCTVLLATGLARLACFAERGPGQWGEVAAEWGYILEASFCSGNIVDRRYTSCVLGNAACYFCE
jgi:hypothetical protein